MRFRVSSGLATLALLAITTGAAAADGPTVSQAWARATAPGVDVGAVYLTIDGGKTGDSLVSASSERAAMVHLHTVEESGGVAKMRAVDGIEVPAGKRVVLAPKGTHIMLMGLAKPLVAGETFPLELRFAKAGELGITVVVRAAGSDAPPPPSPR
jgi:periplasmic copper chaperone A